MRSTPLRFPGGAGQELAAILDRPVDAPPRAYALFAHCFTCSKDLKAVQRIGRALTAQGFAVLRFDFTGLGASDGAFDETTFSSNVADLRAAAAWLAREHAAPQVVIGHSLGGTAVLQAAAGLPSVRAVATLGAPCDPAHVVHHFEAQRAAIERDGVAEVVLGGRSFRVRRQLLEDLAEQSTCAAVRQLGRERKALLVLHSPVDETVEIDNAARIFDAALHPKSFVSLDRADHLLTGADDAAYVGAVVAAWAGKYLDPVAEPDADAPAEPRVLTRTGGDGYCTEIDAGGHALLADEPPGVGGSGLGPSPYQLLGAALGACTGMTLRMYADRKGWPLEEVRVRLEHAKVHARDCADCPQDQPKVDVIEREIGVSGDLSAEQRLRLLEIADRCPVHRTLHESVVVRSRLADDAET